MKMLRVLAWLRALTAMTGLAMIIALFVNQLRPPDKDVALFYRITRTSVATTEVKIETGDILQIHPNPKSHWVYVVAASQDRYTVLMHGEKKPEEVSADYFAWKSTTIYREALLGREAFGVIKKHLDF